MLWAWERPEDLSFLDSSKTGIAFLAAKAFIGRDGSTVVRMRSQQLVLPPGAALLPVVRIESLPRHAPVRIEPLLSALETVAALPGSRGLQIDFDARKSEHAFYQLLITSFRRQTAVPISITALVSWCDGSDGWLDNTSVDEAVPDAAVQAWVGAQDQVFVACSEAPKYPAALGGSASPLARADRDYQIAAAHFYAEDFGEAEQRFRAIAADGHSPWQRTSEYMVGRTLLREASLQNKAAAIPLARQQFAKIADDHSAGSLADSARGLLEHLDAMEHTEAAMASLSKRLLLPKPEPTALADTLGQSTYLLSSDTFSQARSKAGIAEPFDWVQTLESSNGAHALQVWRQKRSLPWLTLALMNAKGKDPAAMELIGEADRLSLTHQPLEQRRTT